MKIPYAMNCDLDAEYRNLIGNGRFLWWMIRRHAHDFRCRYMEGT